MAQNRFHAGLKAGLSTSQVHGDTYSGFNKAGLDGGLVLNGRINDKWSGQFEMLYIQKGSKHDGDIAQNDFTYYKMKLSYLEVPVVFQYYLKNFSFELGPSFGYLISAKEYDLYGQLDDSASPFKPMEVAACVGFNYMVHRKIGMNIRYSNSVLPIRTFNRSGLTIPFDAGQRNNVLAFTLTYLFGKKDGE
jgi:hypothetical protein